MPNETDPELEKILANKKKMLERAIYDPIELPEVVTNVPTGIQRLNDSNFAPFIRDAQVPVLVDVYADWCMPCKRIAPIIQKLSIKYAGKMIFAKLDVDDSPKTAARYHAFSVPTLMFFKDGQLAGRIVGAVPEPKLEAAVKTVLKAN